MPSLIPQASIPQASIQQAMIFAAGEGRRLRPLTLTRPKPLLEVAGKPLIVYWLERLAQAGIQKVVINTGYLGEQLPQTLGDGRHWGLSIDYSVEGSPLETGGGLLKALPLLDASPFWLINADVWCTELPPLYLPEGSLGQLLLVPNPEHHQQGDFSLEPESGWVDNSPGLTFAGISQLHPASLAAEHLQAAYGRAVTAGEAFALAPLLRHLADQRLLSGQRYEGQWMDIGTPERLQALNEALHEP